MQQWRFDQGRLDYFQFDEIVHIAKALVVINGSVKPTLEQDSIRQVLSQYSERPFLPSNYTVWRNYKRVFACQLLATEIDGRIICTDLCKSIASNEGVDVDDYLSHFGKRFYYPSPIFEGYNVTDPQVFPVPAILKFIFSRYCNLGVRSASIEDIASFLIANQVTGLEPITFYDSLKPKEISLELRQVRELVRFISQFSFLKWENPHLYIDIEDKNEIFSVIEQLEPIVSTRALDPGFEVLSMGKTIPDISLGNYTIHKIESYDSEFSEGSKVRITHIRTERSLKLKDFYFKYSDNPEICTMCSLDTNKKYPWAPHIIEIHHLLPLSSPIRVENAKTSIKDVVGLCPTCHRATHKYYNGWLKANDRKDFSSYEEAHEVFYEAKKLVI